MLKRKRSIKVERQKRRPWNVHHTPQTVDNRYRKVLRLTPVLDECGTLSKVSTFDDILHPVGGQKNEFCKKQNKNQTTKNQDIDL